MIIIKSRKQKAEAYEKNYSNIPRDYLERLSWMYDKYHMNINKATEVMKKREQTISWFFNEGLKHSGAFSYSSLKVSSVI